MCDCADVWVKGIVGSTSLTPRVFSRSSLSQKSTDDENHPGRKNKVLSLSPNLPAVMARKYWSLADFSIGRKMYTGYASTVYQVCKPEWVGSADDCDQLGEWDAFMGRHFHLSLA